MTVYHNPDGIANVLSLKSVAEKHRVTYDSRVETMLGRRTLPVLDVERRGT